MTILRLFVQAPFAVFRRFSAGSFRPSSAFMTPTAAYGLLLNLAGVDSRHDDGKSLMTLTREDLPAMRIALGIPQLAGDRPAFPQSASAFQQLHNYPVGNSGKEHAPNTKGTKYNITPVRREFLMNLSAVVAVAADADICCEIERAVEGTSEKRRYGLPFLGDNSFLIDVLTTDARATGPAWWLSPVTEAESSHHVTDMTTRLTTWIDRADSSKSRSGLFAPLKEPSGSPPESAWVSFGQRTA